jgi:hypothetical protein
MCVVAQNEEISSHMYLAKSRQTHLNIIFAISEFEVPFLGFSELSFQRFFSG